MPSAVATGSVPTVHVAGVARSMGVAPAVAKGKKDPCRHRRNKRKKQIFVVYEARQKGGTGKIYVGRTRGPGTYTQALNTRKSKHHRPGIGPLRAVCIQDSYSACRGAEQKHYENRARQGRVIISQRSEGRGRQIAPIRADNSKKQDYLDCAKSSARPSPPGCAVCAA